MEQKWKTKSDLTGKLLRPKYTDIDVWLQDAEGRQYDSVKVTSGDIMFCLNHYLSDATYYSALKLMLPDGRVGVSNDSWFVVVQ